MLLDYPGGLEIFHRNGAVLTGFNRAQKNAEGFSFANGCVLLKANDNIVAKPDEMGRALILAHIKFGKRNLGLSDESICHNHLPEPIRNRRKAWKK